MTFCSTLYSPLSAIPASTVLESTSLSYRLQEKLLNAGWIQNVDIFFINKIKLKTLFEDIY
jgi:hypothetical protein